MGPHPPGTILQHMYLKERLRKLKPGKFVEIGVGSGHISEVLLEAGWSGVGYELNPDSARNARESNRRFVEKGRYQVFQRDWFLSPVGPRVDVDMVISSHVLEHMNEKDEKRYFEKSKKVLKPKGIIVLFLPSCLEYWSIEDEVVGHYRRYTSQDLRVKAKRFGWDILHLAGLTYPLSNWLFPISSLLIRKSEGAKRDLKLSERTRLSGNRNVPFKTTYPGFFKMILNEKTLFPFHFLQKISSGNEKCMNLYVEMLKKA